MDKATHSSSMCFTQVTCGQDERFVAALVSTTARGTCEPCSAGRAMPSLSHRCQACLVSTQGGTRASTLPCANGPLVWPKVAAATSPTKDDSKTGLYVGLTLVCALVVVSQLLILMYRCQSHLDLNRAPYNVYGVKNIDPVSLACFPGPSTSPT